VVLVILAVEDVDHVVKSWIRVVVHKRKYEVKLRFRLERKFERDDERFVHFCENEMFREGVRDFVSRGNACFTESFEGVNPMVVFLADLHDLGYLSDMGALRIGRLNAFPKLPFPMTLRSSKSSILKEVFYQRCKTPNISKEKQTLTTWGLNE
jgi:hypothetical protein